MVRHDAPADVTIRRIAFRNFKAFPRYSIALQHTNVLVGPNNSGKSTIVGASRALASGLRTASARKPERMAGPNNLTWGYRIPKSGIPISLENTHTDLSEPEATVSFFLSNENRVHLQFASDGDCRMFAQIGDSRKSPPDTNAFKREFPISVATIPVLGPLEDGESLLEQKTIDQNMSTHRAARSFRSYWYRSPERFEEFRDLVRQTWPEMDIRPPKLVDPLSDKLVMYCVENEQPRELYWTGFGFQIWCQILTHLTRASEATLFVADELETYLHPEIQRRLIRLILPASPQLLLATHSSEIISELDPRDIVLVDKREKAGRRLTLAQGQGVALETLGSVHSTTLTAVARSRRVLFVEGDDARILLRLAKRAGLLALGEGIGITIHPLGGHKPAEASALSRGISFALGGDVECGVLLDRDFRSERECQQIQESLREGFRLVQVHERKEIENYLLDPRAIALASVSRSRDHSPAKLQAVESCVRTSLDEAVDSLQISTEAQRVEAEIVHERIGNKGRQAVHERVVEEFRRLWFVPEERFKVVSGKAVLRIVNVRLEEAGYAAPNVAEIAEQMPPNAIAPDMRLFLQQLDAFRAR